MQDQALSVDAPSDFGRTEADVVSRWVSEITLAKKAVDAWHKRGDRIIKRYTDEVGFSEGNDTKKRRYCLLWANVQTLAPAVYARTPTAVVGRRWKDDDPVARASSEVLERGLNFSLDAMDFADMMTNLRDEFLLVARGQAWVRYVPHIVTRTKKAPAQIGAGAGEGGEGEGAPRRALPGPTEGQPQPAEDERPVEAPDGQVTDVAGQYDEVIWEEVLADHVHWKDFLTNPGRTWAEVRWCARRVFMDRDELITRFGAEKGKECPLNWHVDPVSTTDGKEDTQFNKAEVWEIWDKRSRKVFWICTAFTSAPLDARDDPLKLKEFFPCPRPLLGTCGPDSIVPTPDYEYYVSQAGEIDDLTRRISLLTDALKVRGFYRGQANQTLTDLLAGETNTITPIEDWQGFVEAGGATQIIQYLPLDVIAAALKACIETRQQMLDDVFQITGIADIMRGDGDPNETATAQNLKATWGSSRVRDKQKELARFARDLIRLMGEVIATKFSGETLTKMTGIKLLPDQNAKAMVQQRMQLQAQAAQAQHAPPQPGQPPAPPPQPPQLPPQLQRMMADPTWADVEGLLRDDAMRSFSIDIETDSTIEPNDQQEKQRRVEFVEAVATYLEKTMPVVQLSPELLPVVIEGLKFLVRGFRVGREMEDVIDAALDQLQAKAAGGGMQPQQKPGPNPQVEAMKGQAAVMGAQARVSDAQTNQFKAQTDRMAAQAGASLDAQRIHNDQQDAHLDRATDVQMQGHDLQADLRKAVMTSVTRHLVHDINSPKPIEAPTQ